MDKNFKVNEALNDDGAKQEKAEQVKANEVRERKEQSGESFNKEMNNLEKKEDNAEA